MKFKSQVLDNFVSDVRSTLGDNLVAILVYGSRVWGYAKDGSSEWDIYIVLNEPAEDAIKQQLMSRNPEIDIEYFATMDEFYQATEISGGWSSYAVLLNATVPVYTSREYIDFVKKMKIIRPNKEAIKEKYIKKKDTFDLGFYAKRNLEGFRAAKWTYHSINKRLQILTYFKKDIITVDFDEALRANLDLLSAAEISFIREMRRRTFGRIEQFSNSDLKEAKRLISFLGHQISIFQF